MRTWILTALIAVLALAGGLYFYRVHEAQQARTAALEQLLHTALPDVAGKTATLDDWHGQTRVINFWATWCAPCMEEIPAFESIWQQSAGKKVAFIGVALDSADNVKTFQQHVHMTYPVLIAGTTGMDLASLAGDQEGAIPFTLVLDGDNHVLAAHAGRLSADNLRHLLGRAASATAK